MRISNFTNLRDEISLDNRVLPPLAVLVNQSGKTHEITRKRNKTRFDAFFGRSTGSRGLWAEKWLTCVLRAF